MFSLLQNIQKSFDSGSAPADGAADSNKENPEKNPMDEIKLSSSSFAGKLVNYAKIVSNVAQDRANQIGTILSENSIIGELDRRKQNFMQELEGEGTNGNVIDVPMPWDGVPDVNAFRKHVFALSLEERNFLAEAPSDNVVDPTQQKVVGQKLLEMDVRLGEMRYRLVPKRISEENFWKNYFYRIEILKKLVLEKRELETDAIEQTQSSSTDASDDLKESETLKLKKEKPKSSCEGKQNCKITKDPVGPASLSSATIADEDWERELLGDIGEFELVANGTEAAQKSDAEWDAEIQAMLAAEMEGEKKDAQAAVSDHMKEK